MTDKSAEERAREIAREEITSWIIQPTGDQLNALVRVAIRFAAEQASSRDEEIERLKAELHELNGTPQSRFLRLYRELESRFPLTTKQLISSSYDAEGGFLAQVDSLRAEIARLERIEKAASRESLTRRAMRAAEDRQDEIAWTLRDEHEESLVSLDAALSDDGRKG